MDENNINLLSAEEKAQELARGHFREGLNCSECVLLAFMETHETGMPTEILALSTGFGAGIGHTKNICGAITGAVMALGLEKGRKNPFEAETPRERAGELKEIYPVFADMTHEIENRYGSLLCSEITGPLGDFNGKERRKNCQEIIGYCARLAAKYAEK